MVTTRIIFLVTIFVTACISSEYREKLIGNWNYCKDGTYFELYVTDSVIYEINDKIPLLTKEHYILNNVILKILSEDKTVKKEIKISGKQLESLSFKYKYDGEVISLRLFKINERINIPFYDKSKPETIEIYEEEFMNRARRFREEHSCKKENKPHKILDE